MMLVRTMALLAIAMVSHAAWATPILLQEIHYDGSGPDARDAFTELVGPPGANLEGWTLVGVNGSTGSAYRTLTLSGLIPLDGIFVIATSSANSTLAAERDLIANVDWQNGPDAVQLWSPLRALMDALQYGDAGPHNSGEGTPADDAPPGLSLSRDSESADSDDNATDFRTSDPTPGRIAAIPVPEPAALPVFLTATVLLFRIRNGRR